MNRKLFRSLMILMVIATVASMVLAACGGTPTPAATQAPAATTAPAATAAPSTSGNAACTPAGNGATIGISMSDFATERWKPEADLMQKLLEAKGYKVLVQEANHDVKLQNDQIDNMVSQGAKGLIIVAEDGAAAATAVDKAAAAGVKAIAYDRLIKSPNIAAYLSFNNEEVGRQQALGVLKAANIDGGTWTTANPLKVVMLGGSPTDNNAILFRKGQMDIVQPYVDKGVIKIVADQWVDNWDAANALKLMENILTAQKNAVDAVVASNDGTALGALQALKAQGLAGKVPISGQDATADGSNSIVKGDLTVSILKDIRNLAPIASDLVDGLLQCTPSPDLKQFTMAELTNDPKQAGNVQAVFLPVQQVNKDNVYDLVVKSGFQPYDLVYTGIPDAQKPPKPDLSGGTAPAAACTAVGSGATIGISMSDFATERWKPEADLMQKLLEAKGYKVLVQEANHDVKLQNDQIDNMVSQGAKGLIIVAEDGAAAATAVDKAAAAGVKAIAYDRLIKSPNIAAYLSFNNEEVGRQQALGVLKAANIDGGTWTTANPLKVVMLGGSPTDNNAILFRKGQMDIVQPYVDKGVIKIVADQWVDNWDAANALKLMENILTAQKNAVDAVVASNDGTALGALQALKAQGLAGKVPISGQDATADGSNSIVKGELTVSILKDIRNLAPIASDLMDGLLQCTPSPDLKQFTMAELTNDPKQAGNVQAVFLPVQQVNKDNVFDLVVKSGFQPYDAVYTGIPDAQKPPKPDLSGGTAPAAACTAVGSGATIGISMSDFATERWKPEADLMQKLLEAKGYKVLVQEANHDVKLQNDQIDNMVSQGAKGLIIVAEDGAAAATAVDKAAAAGVKAIAYDRLIKSPNIAAYLSFNNEEVGRQQALGVLKAANIDGGTWTTANPLKVVMLGGSPTDNNAILFRKGQMDIVQPYVDKGVIKIVADQWVDNWDAANALKLMENILTAQKNAVDAVVASNDGTALGALQALKAQGLAGKVPISGQDATADGSNSIVKGELTVSILKDIRNLAPIASDLMDGLLQCTPSPDLKQFTMAELTNDPKQAGNVQAVFLPVQQVNKDNVFDLVVKSGFQPYDAVYTGIPDAQKPPKP